MNVVGLDLSITATGVAHHHGELDTWHLTAAGDRRLAEIAQRMGDIVNSVFRPDLTVIEDMLFTPRAARSTGITSMVHGVVRCVLVQHAAPYMLVSPSVLKTYATGKGNATKPDMRMELFKRTGLDVKDDNQVDAWWLRALGLDLHGAPVLDLPKDHRRALDKLELPARAAA